MTLKENSQLIFYFSTLFSVSAPFGLTALAKATMEGLGLDGLTEQSAKL